MTKEELEKEAERKLDELDLIGFDFDEWSITDAFEEGYIRSAEPREKQIQIDAEQIRALQKQNGELTDKVKELDAENERIKNSDTLCKLIGEQKRKIVELEAQIEKMKCCENCGWYYLQQHWRESKEINESRMFHCGTCGNKRNWKLKEIKEK